MLYGWQVLERAARASAAHFTHASCDPIAAQTYLLQQIVTANRDCEFGRRHGFSNIDSLDAFRRRVPISAYAAFAPEIERIANGALDVLTSAPIVAFEETGGTSSGAKLIPILPRAC